jgi:hypothetical protein
VSTVPLGLGRIADSPIELTGEAATPADPVGPRPLSATIDYVLVAAGSAAVLSPFVIIFAIMNLRALEPTGVLPLGILACLVVPSLLVFRYGTLGEVASAQAGFPPRVIAEAPPSAPLWMRAVAFASDISAYIAFGVLLAAVPVALALVVIVSFPVSFPMAIGAVGATVAALIMGRRPWAVRRSPGLEAWGLRRVLTASGPRTVRASALAAEDGTPSSAWRRGGAVLWLVASCPIVVYLALINGLAAALQYATQSY